MRYMSIRNRFIQYEEIHGIYQWAHTACMCDTANTHDIILLQICMNALYTQKIGLYLKSVLSEPLICN